jgi:hypothetical protein
MRFGDVNVLLGVFRDARADDGEVLLRIRARRTRIDEGIPARNEIDIANDSGLQSLMVPGASKFCPFCPRQHCRSPRALLLHSRAFAVNMLVV